MKYSDLLERLKELHKEQMEHNVAGNPALIGEAMVKMRQTANLILPFINQAIDRVNELEELVAEKRQEIYEKNIAEGKSPSASQVDARELTQMYDAQLNVAKNDVQKLRNDFLRFDTLCSALQSRLREHNTDKIFEGKT